ncbi:MAG: TetR/AcrR family transcriptional regulator [Acidimicrobiales bacterium]
MATLQDRRHAQTRSEIVDAAFALFDEHGFAAVTMEEISQRAGVSRSTVYRRFPTKDDVVLEIPRRWLVAFDDAVAELPPELPLFDAFTVASDAVAAHIDENDELVRAAYRVLAMAPHLGASASGTTEWLHRIGAMVRRHSELDDETAEIIAGACLGALDSMMSRWARGGGRETVASATVRLEELLRPLLG